MRLSSERSLFDELLDKPMRLGGPDASIEASSLKPELELSLTPSTPEDAATLFQNAVRQASNILNTDPKLVLDVGGSNTGRAALSSGARIDDFHLRTEFFGLGDGSISSIIQDFRIPRKV